MNVRHPHGDTVAFRRVPLTARGVPTGAPPVVFEVGGCAIERLATQEVSRSVGGNPTDDYRDTTVTTMKVFLPPGSGVEITDRAWLPGEDRGHRPMWRLTSLPYRARNPFTGAYPGDEITIERVDG